MRRLYKPNFRELIDPQVLFLVAILLIIGIIFLMFFTDKVDGFKKNYRKKYLAYIISMLLLFAFVPFLGTTRVITQLLDEFVFYQIAFLVLGAFHAVVYRNYFKKFKKNDPGYWSEILFNILVLIFCTITFIISYTYFHGKPFLFNMLASLIPFIIPTWIYVTYLTSIRIPAKYFTTWQFPKEGTFIEPKDEDYRDLVVVTFIFNKVVGSKETTEFRAKSPIRMDFGKLFYHFAYDYNDRNPDSPIELEDEDGSRQHWVFYLKPNWYSTSKYLDPKYPLYMNGIEENSVIYCLRTAPQYDDDDIEELLDENQEGIQNETKQT